MDMTTHRSLNDLFDQLGPMQHIVCNAGHSRCEVRTMKLERELMRGAAPTAVMQLLSSGEKYGYELVEALSQKSNGVLAMGQSTLYPLLYTLEAKGLVTSRVDEKGARPRRFYRLTASGRRNVTATLAASI